MKSLLTAWLPLPPSTNKLYGQRGGQRFKLPEVQAYQEESLYRLTQAQQYATHIDAARSANSSLYVSIHAYLRKAAYKRRDVDNMAKIVLDTVLNVYLQIDDSRVVDLWLSKRPTASAGSILVAVAEFEEKFDDERSVPAQHF